MHLLPILFGTGVTVASVPDYNNLTVALLRAPPANWQLPLMNMNWTNIQFSLNDTVDKGIDLIEEAPGNGANLVIFPELWFPGYDLLFFRMGRGAYNGAGICCL